MTDTVPFPRPPEGRARPPMARRFTTLRVVVALVLREMSTTYGRSYLGYLWAILEPVAGIMLMTVLFSYAFRTPGIGTSFALFFASGILPFGAYMELSSKIAVAVRFNRALLNYPGVTFVDAILARIALNVLTNILVVGIIFTGIIWIYDVDVIIDMPALAYGFVMAYSLGIGIGTLNCYLLSIYPIWERTWAILNRPMFLISCIFFMYDTVPMPYRDWLWWNPLIHIIGQTRTGIYATYDASYVSPLYVFSIALVTLAAGLLLLRRHYREILNL